MSVTRDSLETEEDLRLYISMLEKSLLTILRETEGVFITLDEYKLLIYKEKGEIIVNDASDIESFKDGVLVWCHPEENLN